MPMHMQGRDYPPAANKQWPLYGWIVSDAVLYDTPVMLTLPHGPVRQFSFSDELLRGSVAAGAEEQPPDPLPRRVRLATKTTPRESCSVRRRPSRSSFDTPPPHQATTEPQPTTTPPAAAEASAAEPPCKRPRVPDPDAGPEADRSATDPLAAPDASATGLPRKRRWGPPPPPAPDPTAAATVKAVAGTREATKTIAARWALLQEYRQLEADPTLCLGRGGPNGEMLKRKRRGYYHGCCSDSNWGGTAKRDKWDLVMATAPLTAAQVKEVRLMAFGIRCIASLSLVLPEQGIDYSETMARSSLPNFFS